MRSETKYWLDLASDDYKNSLLLWENHRYGATVFFCQQAVEKILKAYIIEYRREAPVKTHKIEALLKLATLDIQEIDNPDVTELSKAYIRVRYPDLNKQYYRRRETVEPLVVMARKVYLWVKTKFKKA